MLMGKGDVMPTRNVNLTDHYDQFVETSISDGRFANASEVMRAGLALLERQDAEDKARLEWLRGAVQEGLDALEGGDFKSYASVDALEADIRALGREVSQEIASARARG